MNTTKLLYLDDFSLTTCQAHVIALLNENERMAVVLDQTVFYPQGGGQPCDQGEIKTAQTTFAVQDVRLVDGIVKHFGYFSSGAPFAIGETVTCTIDSARRTLNSRVHSAGHVIDKALFELNFEWEPGKSYHFPNGPYVEYSGGLHNVDVEKLKTDIEHLCAKWATEGLPVKSKAVDKAAILTDKQLMRRCKFLANLPENKPIYVIAYGENFASPCSGTHVLNVSEIGNIIIRKIKEADGGVRISYDVPR